MASIISAGTTDATSLNVSSDKTGILQLASNNAVTAVTIDASQNVGIGTVSPSTRLDVVGGSSVSAAIIKPQGSLPNNNDNAGLYVLHQGTGGTAFRVRTDQAVSASMFAHILVNNVGAACTALQVDQYGTSPIADFTKSGTVALRIDNSGNVGIGTSSPQSKLMSQPTGAFTAAGTISNAGLNLTSSNTTGGLAGQSIVWSNYGTSGSAVQAYISACTYGSNFMAFSSTGSSEAMRIDSSGNLLVNQTSQTGAEKVGISFSRAGGWGLAIKNTSATSPSNATYVSFYYTSTNTGGINSTGTTTTYDSASDYRLKENIAPMTGALAKVTQLKPCTYTWKINGSAGQGFLAHELQEIVSDCVRGNKDDVNEDGSIKPQMIDTSFLVATLTAAIQELKAINDTQAETINALTARIETLENK